MQMISKLLSDFCLASGLRINVVKSRAFVGAGVDRARRARIFSITFISFTSHLGKYLGFPILRGRQKASDFLFCSWKGKLLNKAGRVTLVKSVLNAISVYPMQFFWFPQAVCDRLDGLSRNFICPRGIVEGWIWFLGER